MKHGGKKAPHNTVREIKEQPAAILAEAMMLGSDGMILRQEAQGQRSFVGSDTLPTRIHSVECLAGAVKEYLQAAGIKFLGPVADDDLFQYVELPQGWKKVPTDHSMWSHLLDDKGRERAAIFYKAAFYDRDAHLTLTSRFQVKYNYDREDKEGVAVVEVTDGTHVAYTTEPIALPEDKHSLESLMMQDAAMADAEGWVEMRHPNWRDPKVYWD